MAGRDEVDIGMGGVSRLTKKISHGDNAGTRKGFVHTMVHVLEV